MNVGPRKKADIPDWAREAIEQSFDEPSQKSVRDERGSAAWPLFVEAATVTQFVPQDLQPGVLDGNARQKAEKELLRFAELSEGDLGFRWSLTGAARRDVLEACEPGELLAVVSRTRSVDPVQSAVRELVSGTGSVDLSSRGTRNLEAMRIATTWLSGAKVALPALAEIDRELELRSLLAPFERMTGARNGGDRFFGRDDEVETLRAYVGVVPAARFAQRLARAAAAVVNYVTRNTRSPISVWGPGGVGKTTLIAVFMLEHARAAASKFPFVYLDFDRSTISATNRAALLMEMCRQVGAQFEKLTASMNELRERLAPIARDVGRTAESDAISRLVPHLASFRSLIDGAFSSEPFLLVFDTFEVVQYGPDQVAALEEMIRELGTPGEGWPRLRLVVSGRAEVKRFTVAMQPLKLGALDHEGSVRMLEALARDAGKPVTADDAERLISAIVKVVRDRSNDGVRPLRLRLLGELFRNAESGSALVASLIEEFTNPKSEKKQTGELLFNGIVVRRTIGHVRDRDVAALTDPGLVVRRITKDVIRNVMTRGTPKDAGDDPGDPETFEPWIVDDARSQKIFDAFANEVSLVERDGDALRHRQDVRQDMLPLIRDKRPRAFQRLHRLAFEHFLGKATESREDMKSRGEAVYHGLWLGGDLDELDKLWPPVDPQIDENEFEPGSEPEIYLRLKRRKDITADEVRKLTANVGLSWLAQRKDDITGELRLATHVEMIRAIGGDGYHVFDGHPDLAAVAARVLYRAGMWRDAAVLVRRHVTPELNVEMESHASLVRTWATLAAKWELSAREFRWALTFAQIMPKAIDRAEVLAHLSIAVPSYGESVDAVAPHQSVLHETLMHVGPTVWRREMRTLRLVIATGIEGTDALLPFYVDGTKELPRDSSVASILSRMRRQETRLDEIDRVWLAERYRFLDSFDLRDGLRALAAADHSDWIVPFGNAIMRGFDTHGREIAKHARTVTNKAAIVERALNSSDGHSLVQALVTHGVLVRFAEQLARSAQGEPPESAPGMAALLIQWHRKTMPKVYLDT